MRKAKNSERPSSEIKRGAVVPAGKIGASEPLQSASQQNKRPQIQPEGAQNPEAERDASAAVCARCVQDGSVPALFFDRRDVCNFCHIHDEMEKEFSNDERGARILQKLFHKAEKKAGGAKYNCAVGASGGRDSTFLLWLAVKKWKLRPLAVHFNDGFDNPIAGENMLKACRKLNIDLETVTSHWEEARDLKIAFLKASVPDLNLGTDIGIAAALYGTARKRNIKTVMI